MYRKISLVDAEKVYIKTFGGFDLYYRGKEIDFSNAKAKELLAVLVDQGGREISLHEMAQILSTGKMMKRPDRQFMWRGPGSRKRSSAMGWEIS